MSWQKIGKEVFLTGQAVAARVTQMEEQGIITGYGVRQDNAERHFITVFMANSDFEGFEAFLKNTTQVENAYKVTGEGCYHVVWQPDEGAGLECFLDGLLIFGRYKVATAIRCIK